MKEHRVVSGRCVMGWSALGKLGRRGTGHLGGPQGAWGQLKELAYLLLSALLLCRHGGPAVPCLALLRQTGFCLL